MGILRLFIPPRQLPHAVQNQLPYTLKFESGYDHTLQEVEKGPNTRFRISQKSTGQKLVTRRRRFGREHTSDRILLGMHRVCRRSSVRVLPKVEKEKHTVRTPHPQSLQFNTPGFQRTSPFSAAKATSSSAPPLQHPLKTTSNPSPLHPTCSTSQSRKTTPHPQSAPPAQT